MFLCKDCTIEDCHWLFDLAMSLSYGPCEMCEKVGPCVDVKANCIKPEEVEEDAKSN